MFSFIVIYIVSLLLAFILFQLIDKLFLLRKKIKSKVKFLFFIGTSLLFSFILSIIGFALVLKFLFQIPTYLGLETKQQISKISISTTDCLPLTNTIQKTEILIGQKENHRYLEETAHLFTIKLQYQKAADKLKEQAQIYNNLELSADAKEHAQKIATKFQEQSDLFTQRTTITTNKAGIKQVYKILEKMDRVDQERLKLINQVKQKCGQA